VTRRVAEFWAKTLPKQRFQLLGKTFVTAFALLMTLLVALAGCADTSAGHVQPTAPPSPTSSLLQNGTPLVGANLPALAITRWRLAYLAADGHLHLLTFDGKQDTRGPVVPDMNFFGLDFASAGISPNGATLAYSAASGLTILDVGGRGTRTQPAPPSYQMAWSPDGSRLALGDGIGGIWTVRASVGSPTAVHGTPRNDTYRLAGWLDATHVAVSAASDSNSNAFALNALDVNTGALRHIATITVSGIGKPQVALSPDGKQAIFWNAPFQDEPFTPLAAVINIASGAVRKLPGITKATGSGFTSLAWKPGSQTVAVSTGFATNSNLQAWLLDVQGDSAIRLSGGQYVVAWAPSNSILVLSTSNTTTVGEGPHSISVAVFSGGRYSLRELTRGAKSFPIVGFAQTP
jgi:hypothetical protein